jgi:hypothetical protein
MINIVKGWWQRAPRKLWIDPVPCRREAQAEAIFTLLNPATDI